MGYISNLSQSLRNTPLNWAYGSLTKILFKYAGWSGKFESHAWNDVASVILRDVISREKNVREPATFLQNACYKGQNTTIKEAWINDQQQ